jgi:acetate kinase
MDAGKVLVVNAGSSSLKLRLLADREEPLAARDLGVDDDWQEGIDDFLGDSTPVDLAGHRIVHGGVEFTEPTRLDGETMARLQRLEDLAPLHNAPALRAVRALHALRPELPAVACFDTAFHRSLPAAASTYAIPPSWRDRWPVHRFGFHGLSHAYCARRVAFLLGRPVDELRLITAHLGAGASLAAIAGGCSVDTTMGFSPLDGLVMATRSGSVDPGLLLWVQHHGGISAQEAEKALFRESGLLGLSGRSSDMRELFPAAETGNKRASLAIEVYLHRLRAAIASMAAAMGGFDALSFAGGVGEGSPEVRAAACRGLGFLGLAMDPDRNSTDSGDRIISSDEGEKAILVIHTREDLEIAAQARSVMR